MGSASKRTDIVSRELADKPGPGSYERHDATFGANSQKVSIRGKPKE